MDAYAIKESIRKLKESGKTSFESCQKLVILEQAYQCLCKDGDGLKDIHRTDHDGGTCHRLTWKDAEMWVSGMKNSDGSHGQCWSMDQVQQVMKQRDINCDPVQFYAALNAVYSDYCAVARKHKVDNIDFYVDLAKAWLDDDDAVEDKARRYYECIVKH